MGRTSPQQSPATLQLWGRHTAFWRSGSCSHLLGQPHSIRCWCPSTGSQMEFQQEIMCIPDLQPKKEIFPEKQVLTHNSNSNKQRVFQLCSTHPSHLTGYFQCCLVIKEQLGSLWPSFPGSLALPTHVQDLKCHWERREPAQEKTLQTDSCLECSVHQEGDGSGAYEGILCLPRHLHGRRNRSEQMNQTNRAGILSLGSTDQYWAPWQAKFL